MLMMKHSATKSSEGKKKLRIHMAGIKALSSTTFPPIRCSWIICSKTSGVQEWYQTLSGCTTAIGPF